jgi:hypothetical protein
VGIDNLTDVDFNAMYSELQTLGVEMHFTTDVGFPYLQTKMAEVMDKSEQAVGLSLRVAKLSSQLVTEQAYHEAQYHLTSKPHHAEAAKLAKQRRDGLKDFSQVLKLRMARLKALPYELKTYCQIMEDALQIERHAGGMRRQSRLTDIPRGENDAPAGDIMDLVHEAVPEDIFG